MTTDTTDYASLIERLEKGSGEDRELDYDISWLALSDDFRARHDKAGFQAMLMQYAPASVPHYTSSLDAALAFAEAVLPGWGVALTRYPRSATNPDGWYVKVYEPDVPGGGDWDGCENATAARALLSATLRALAKDTTDD